MTISRQAWRSPPSRDVARQRLSGRWKYNCERQAMARQRREVVKRLLWELGWDRVGVLREIAALLAVSVATVCRDRRALERDGW